MQSVLTWGLDVIGSVQKIASPLLTLVMKGISLTGSPEFYLIFLPLIYWCVDRRKGLRLELVLLLSIFLNLWLKELLMQPRPFHIDPALGLDFAESYGLPSGHAQGSAVFWGMLALLFRRPQLAIATFLVPLVVGFSRIYLGVHFPTDVFAGWILAAACIGLYGLAWKRVESWFRDMPHRFRVIAVAVGALIMNFLLPGDTMVAGAFLGSGLGFIFVWQGLRFSTEGSFRQRLVRYILGMASAVIVYALPKLLIGDAFPQQEGLIRFLRYALFGAWVAYGVPYFLFKLGFLTLEKDSGQEDAV